MLPSLREAFAASGHDVAQQKAALHHLTRWLSDARYATYVPAIADLLAQGNTDELIDAFRTVLPFGTGGRRGRVGVGPNRMNADTVASSVQGHVNWLRGRGASGGDLVLAYDVRSFGDASGLFSTLPECLQGASSRAFAELAASIYVANGFRAHILPTASTRYLSTPELSFTIRELGALGGLNISASHNPPDDNGVKVYGEDGAQLLAPHDQSLLEAVAAVDEVRSVPFAELGAGCIELSEAQHQAWVQAVASRGDGGSHALPIRYTPLHGAGLVDEVLSAAGYQVERFALQADADGAFPTVPGHVANPERIEAMQLAMHSPGGHQLVFGTDPDADRIGCEVLHEGEWVHLSGNEIGVLVVDAMLRRGVPEGKKPLVVRTEVTSGLVSAVARAGGAVVVDDLLVGFKYIGQVLRTLETEGVYGNVVADEVVYVAGVEESHGVLVQDDMRDKDAAGGALALAELATSLHAQSKTLVDRLHELQREHGYVRNGQISVQFPGAAGRSAMEGLLARWRADAPTELAGRPVLTATDHLDEGGRFGPYLSASDAAARNVLVFALAPADDLGARVILRPSGTEPKLKVYLELSGAAGLDSAGRRAVDVSFAALKASVEAALKA